MTHLGRKSWTSASNGAVKIKQTQKHVTIHYPGFGSNAIKTAGWSNARCFQQLRAWRKQHVGSGAYKEVAYNFYALPTGDFVDGRGLRQNGANGTQASNRAGLSIQVLIGDNEALTAGHIRAVNACLAYIAKHYPQAVRTLYGHQHWVQTRCPGPKVMAALNAGTFRAVSSPSGGASAPAKPAVQNGKLTEDGRLGTATIKVLQKRLGVTQDGRAGEGTWKALQKLLGTVVDGAVSHQSYRATELGNGIVPRAWRFTGRGSKGSKMVVALQKKVGVTADGVWYEGTTKALQKALNAGNI